MKNKKHLVIVCWLLSLHSPCLSFGEHSGTTTLQLMLLQQAPAIVAGRSPNPDTETSKNTVMLLVTTDQGDGVCTGTVVDGCVLTAGHCLDGAKKVTIYKGIEPKLDEPIGVMSTFRTKGKPFGPDDDVAIIKPKDPLRGIGFSRKVLGDKDIPDGTEKFHIVGYGQFGTREVKKQTKNGEEVDLEGYGSKRQRVGVSFFAGYGRYEEKDDKSLRKDLPFTLREGKMVLDKAGPLIWVTRANSRNLILGNIIAPGDSGGPLFSIDKDSITLQGIAGNGINGTTIDRRNIPDQAYAAAYAPVSRNRKWITDHLNELNCKKND